MKKGICFCSIFILLSMVISGCGSSLKKYSMTSTDLGFDTVVTFTAYAENEATFQQYYDLVKEEFKRYDQLFDKYNTYEGISNIKTINDAAGIKAIKVDADIIALLTQSRQYSEFTNQQFDSTMGSLLAIWHDAREAGLLSNAKQQESYVPDKNVLAQAAQHRGWEHVHIDEQNHTVYIDDKNISLDVGGDAKGFAVEQIALQLEKMGCKHAIINGGGNIRLIGNKPEDEHWTVGVQIPNLKEQSTDSLLSISLSSNMSIVTSGDYQRYYLHGDEIMHHIIDPSTWMPARHARAVSVVTEDSGIADILSTTLYTLSHEDGEKLLEKLKKQGIEANAIWVYDHIQPKEDASESFSSHGYDIVVSTGLKDRISYK